eukprot:CAMPEP_0170605176 /NCGR_PEP_ID=MMETSP0224-20130122/19834_1 /TAXON_ID=285029 /ORGANISM="Togula jolla, Strain CCCM 725" /LENGTH=92 /DNA_ID=CAMNT_0010930163 /DNA_START=193 /DNA_END=471 /DNA_ORIENTATION=+
MATNGSPSDHAILRQEPHAPVSRVLGGIVEVVPILPPRLPHVVKVQLQANTREKTDELANHRDARDAREVRYVHGNAAADVRETPIAATVHN